MKSPTKICNPYGYTVEELVVRQDILETGLFVFPLRKGSKAPAVKSWRHGKLPDGFRPDDVAPAYGIELTDEFLVIDLDPKNFEKGLDPLALLLINAGMEPDGVEALKTLVVKTPSGGHHLYYRKPKTAFVRKNITFEMPSDDNEVIRNAYRGIDFLSEGAYVVGPTSVIQDMGRYTIVQGRVSEIAYVPTKLLKHLCRLSGEQAPRKRGNEEPLSYEDNDENVCQRYIDFLKKCLPAFQGQNGDSTTFKTACVGRDLGLSPEKNFYLMLEHYNPRCIPEWDTEELKTKVYNAYEYARGELGASNTGKYFTDQHAGTIDSETALALTNFKWDLIPNKPGQPPELRQNSRHNVSNFFCLKDFGGNPNPMFRILGYNLFTDQVEYLYRPPYLEGSFIEKAVTENDYLLIADWIYTNFNGYRAQIKTIREGVRTFALKTNSFHPVRNYLSSLVWDGTPRLDRMLIDYMGVEDSKYARCVSKSFMIGAVARVTEPGCKFDNMLVLEGEQGIGKGTFCKILGREEWHCEVRIDPHNPNMISEIQGVWVVEVPEMEFTKKADVMAVKAFITSTKDRKRKAYEPDAKNFHRQCIFIGSINPGSQVSYLKDVTGNRRFWPVACRGLDKEGFEKNIDQLWAEAAYRYAQKEQYHLTEADVLLEAQEQQLSRTTVDPWLVVISEWLQAREQSGNPVMETTPVYIATNLMNIPSKDLKPIQVDRIADLLDFRLNFVKVSKRDRNGVKQNIYCNPNYYDPAFYM